MDPEEIIGRLHAAMTVESGEERSTIPDKKLSALVEVGALHHELDTVRQVRQGIIPPRTPEQIAVLAQNIQAKGRFIAQINPDQLGSEGTAAAQQMLDTETIMDSWAGPNPRDYADAFEAVRRAQDGLAAPGSTPSGQPRPGSSPSRDPHRQHGRDHGTDLGR